VLAFEAAADDMVVVTATYKDLATALGVKVASYEGGPGYAVGAESPGSKGLNTMIETARADGMFDAVYVYGGWLPDKGVRGGIDV
jgi:hypothetical protein